MLNWTQPDSWDYGNIALFHSAVVAQEYVLKQLVYEPSLAHFCEGTMAIGLEIAHARRYKLSRLSMIRLAGSLCLYLLLTCHSRDLDGFRFTCERLSCDPLFGQ